MIIQKIDLIDSLNINLFLKEMRDLLSFARLLLQDSFKNVSKWLEDIDHYSNEKVYKVLVGNKADLHPKRAVDYAEAKVRYCFFVVYLPVYYISHDSKKSHNLLCPSTFSGFNAYDVNMIQ